MGTRKVSSPDPRLLILWHPRRHYRAAWTVVFICRPAESTEFHHDIISVHRGVLVRQTSNLHSVLHLRGIWSIRCHLQAS